MITRGLLTLALVLCLASPSWAAVSFGTKGAVGSGTTGAINFAYPASTGNGDLLVLCIVDKYPATDSGGPPTPSGWTAQASATADPGDGPAAGLGATRATIFTKVSASESGNLAVTTSAANVVSGLMLRYVNATAAWLMAADTGGDTTEGTSTSAATSGNLDITGGDMVIVCAASNNNTQLFSVEALTTTGITYGTMTEQNDSSTSLGDDVGPKVADFAVTSGDESSATTFTATGSAGGGSGAVAFLRIREDNAAATALPSNSGFLGAIIK